MKSRLMYVELKTGHSDDGPAWIGKALFSKTGKSVYFNGLAFQKYSRGGGNHCEVLSGDYYWISGIKKRGTNRHWAGHGKIKIDKGTVDEYLEIKELSILPENKFEIVELDNDPPIKKINELMNLKF
ncbi:MAG: mannose-1-phosphate guanylyltransferase [Mucilaginibacter sp.]